MSENLNPPKEPRSGGCNRGDFLAGSNGCRANHSRSGTRRRLAGEREDLGGPDRLRGSGQPMPERACGRRRIFWNTVLRSQPVKWAGLVPVAQLSTFA